ncbi:hypothetical protein PQX77_018305 [Marasmius sp. AFHP31]|nr:hypothetical protein PQX77_018305 [Marasmius sp. AFHP31]
MADAAFVVCVAVTGESAFGVEIRACLRGVAGGSGVGLNEGMEEEGGVGVGAVAIGELEGGEKSDGTRGRSKSDDEAATEFDGVVLATLLIVGEGKSGAGARLTLD